jgi:hypothetical protein
MNDTLECAVCHAYNAFHKGLNYECPNCNSAWNENEIIHNELEQTTDDYFEKLLKLKKPYFKLKHGKIHECTVGYMRDEEFVEEQQRIVPLAFKPNSNCFFIVYFIEKSHEYNPNTLQDLSEMDFTTIWNDGLENYFNYRLDIVISAIATTAENNTILTQGSIYSNFKELN